MREDLQWGVSRAEYDFHTHTGWSIAAPYQVGVLTGNECYTLDTSWFDSANPEGNVLESYADAPPSANLVDDIWLAGHLARLGIKRFIVPITWPSIHIAKTKTLSGKMGERMVSRARANEKTLAWFGASFKRDGIPYKFGGKEQPEKRSWCMRLLLPIVHWLMNITS